MQNEREKSWKDISKKQDTKKDLFNDIDNLNDDSFVPETEESQKTPLTEEEKKEIRKNIIIMLIAIVITFAGLILILIFDPFGDKKEEKPKTEQQEEQTEPEEDPDKDNNTPISQLEDGQINSKNYELNNILSEIEYQQYEFYLNDTLFLYKTDNTMIKDINDNNKLFLLSKSNSFTNKIKSNYDSLNLCTSPITVPTAEINTMLEDEYKTTLTKYNNFYYVHYEEDLYVNTVKFVYSNGNYVGTCVDLNNNLVSVAQQRFVSATKQGNNLYIDMKLIFVNQTGVYKDANFKNLISSDIALDIDEYMKQANTYRYTYNLIENEYILNNVSLIK